MRGGPSVCRTGPPERVASGAVRNPHLDDELILDIIDGDAFSAESLTAYINTVPFAPRRIGEMGLFEADGITTTSIALEELDGSIALIPNTPRGAPPIQNKKDKRVMRHLTVPHLPVEDVIKASEIQNVRAFGGGGRLEAVESVVQRRLRRMTTSVGATVEYQRMGALIGLVLDYNGTDVIFNLFNEFGVAQKTVDFVLGTDDTDLEGKCEEVAGNIEDTLGAAVYDHIHVFCGRTWWRKFISHPEIKEAFKYYAQTEGLNPLKDDMRYKGFKFGGLIFEVYRGKVAGVPFVADTEAHAFPVGVPGLFITRFAPADYLDTVNTVGLPLYARQTMDRKNRWLELDVESNPISICTQPEVLNKLTSSN